MKHLNLKARISSLFERLHPAPATVNAVTVKVEKPWAEGKTASLVEECLGEGVHIDHVIRPANCEVLPRSLNRAIHQGDVLVMHVEASAQQRTEAFIGRNLER